MLEWLDSSIGTVSLIWLFLAAFMLHDFEEIIRIEPWFRQHGAAVRRKVPERFRKEFDGFAAITSSQFAAAVCFEFIVFIPITYIAAEHRVFVPFVGFNVILLLHVFMHIAQSLYVKMLVPGIVTAVLITLPYSVYLLTRLYREHLIAMTDIWLSIPFGLLLIPIVLLGHKIGERL